MLLFMNINFFPGECHVYSSLSYLVPAPSL